MHFNTFFVTFDQGLIIFPWIFIIYNIQVPELLLYKNSKFCLLVIDFHKSHMSYLFKHALPELQLFTQWLAAILRVNAHQCLCLQLPLSNGMAVFCLNTTQRHRNTHGHLIKLAKPPDWLEANLKWLTERYWLNVYHTVQDRSNKYLVAVRYPFEGCQNLKEQLDLVVDSWRHSTSHPKGFFSSK